MAGALWGTYGTFVTFLHRFGYSEATIAAVAPISLIIFFFVSLMLRNPKGILPTKKNAIIYLLAGAIGVFGTNLLYAMAMATGLSVGIASVITFSNYFLVMVFSRILWKINISKQKVWSGVAAVIGIILILEIWHDISIPISGILLILGVTLTFAISYTLTNFSINNCDSDPDAFYFWINLIGFIGTLFLSPPGNILSEITASISAFGIVSILMLLGYCIIPQVGCYFFLSRSWLYLDPPSVVIMYCLDPLVATILGFALLGQSLGFTQIAGMIIVLAALIGLQLAERKEMLPHPSN